MIGAMDAHRAIIHAVFAGFMTVAASSVWAADVPAPSSSLPPSAVAPIETAAAPAAAPPAATTAAAPGNQIWECTTNGVRTFSSNPCGAKSTVRQLNPINVMEPPPMYHVTHTYVPPAAPASDRSNYSPSAPDIPDETYADNAYNGGYPAYVVVNRAHHVRSNNAHHRPHPHHP